MGFIGQQNKVSLEDNVLENGYRSNLIPRAFCVSPALRLLKALSDIQRDNWSWDRVGIGQKFAYRTKVTIFLKMTKILSDVSEYLQNYSLQPRSQACLHFLLRNNSSGNKRHWVISCDKYIIRHFGAKGLVQGVLSLVF